ncbi:SusD/RagB family nutrient-binding outer membrane lipoprotein [Mucilaginibacter sp. RCC_168]|uniref:SusD/RagB family nutrient-binding outer membrane lipoprotein n=1 Tax=Mucilaginibacter sp. RCC_168 TaxID=3239221 RepID=UPI003523BF3A
MKTNIYKIIGVVMLFAIILPSCKKDFEKINTDPNTSPTASPKQLLAPALVSVLTANMLRCRTYNNELMQVTVNQSDSEGQVFRYDIKNTWGDYTWNNWYLQLTNFKAIQTIASDSLTLDKGYQGISLICQAWIYSMLTDTYGDVPYSQSIQGKEGNLTPAFDKQKDIYQGIFKQLEDANKLLNGAVNVAASSDPVFNGNTTLWRKFGNSLYLRLLLRISGKAEVSADCIAKIKDIVDNNPGTYPIMANNSESAVLKWTGSGYLTSPFIAGVRAQDFTAPSLCSFFIDNLTKWADPRLFKLSWSIATYGGGYVGVPSGYAPGNAPVKKSYFISTSTTATVKTLMTEPLIGNIMNYAELQFILAEAAAKGWISTPAKTYYDNGVINAITFWLPTFTTPVADYEATADITWDDSLPLDDKMEMIHVQKYYTLFWTDFEQWFEYRRTGHPVLPKGAGLLNGGVMPARIVYPVYVQSANPTNYKAAVAAQGPDLLNTQVWWQKP